jgi:heterogeneous nuclear ribonucleoprotein K
MEDSYGNKRPAEYDHSSSSFGEQNKRAKMDFDTSIESAFRAIVKSTDAGALIGKAGENIKRLRRDHTVQMQVPDSSTSERILQIRGSLENIGSCLIGCFALMEDYKQYTDMNYNAEVRMLIHSPYVGGLIGAKGSRIKEIREKTMANIKIYEDCCPGSTERVFKVSGEAQIVIDTVMRVLSICQEPEIVARAKGNLVEYDPNLSYGPSGTLDVGHTFAPMAGSRGGRSGVRGPPPRGPGPGPGPAPPRRAPGGMPPGPMADYAMGYEYPPVGPGGYGAPPAYPPPHPDEPVDTVKVSVKNEDAGAIIGTGGWNITGVRQRSGAQIKMDDGRSAGVGDKDQLRIITISGTKQQIQFAQYLLQQCVKEDHAMKAAAVAQPQASPGWGAYPGYPPQAVPGRGGPMDGMGDPRPLMGGPPMMPPNYY